MNKNLATRSFITRLIARLATIPLLAAVLATSSPAQQQQLTDEQLQQLLKRFPQADTNKDGVLTQEEVQAHRKKLQQQRAKKAAKQQGAKPNSRPNPPTHANVPYGSDARNVLDFWAAKSDTPTPLVVFIHGGGFRNGSKDNADRAAVEIFLKNGISYMSISYRYLDAAPIQDILRDCARSIQFIRLNAKKFNIDPSRIASYGGSAGAGSSLWLATHPDLAEPGSDDPVLRQSSRITAAGMLSGQATYDTLRWPEFLGPPSDAWMKKSETQAFFGLPDSASLNTPEGKRIRADVDMLGLISKDSAPVFIYCKHAEGPAVDRRHYVHHPKHGQAVQKRYQECGVEAVIYKSNNESSSRDALVAFMIKHLKNAFPAVLNAPAARVDVPAAAQTAYPVSGIVTATGPLGKTSDTLRSDDAALATTISQPTLLYSSDTPALRAALKERNRLNIKTPIVVYMGGFTTNKDDVLHIEKSHRSAVAMTPAAKLAHDIDAGTTEFIVNDPTNGELAIKASTARASDIKDSSKFCFWIRIDDELMRVTSADAATGRVKVERAFDGSKAAPHSSSSVVLSPVYLGSRTDLNAARHTNSWPGGPDYLRYALNPREPASWRFKGALVAGVMKEGYDGAWFDTFQPYPYNLCDALGRKVTYFWDFKTKQTYTTEIYIDALKDYIRGVREVARKATGREPIVFANSATGSYMRGSKQLFNSGTTRDLLDGYCFEDSFIKVKATRAKGRSTAVTATFEAHAADNWRKRLANHADAASSGLYGICMAGPAGYLAAYFNPTQPGYEKQLAYSYASFLLTVTKERTTTFGLPLFVGPGDNRAAMLPWPRMLFVPVGDPVQANDLDALKVANSVCYRREFERALVYVNPGKAAMKNALSVPAGYVDINTGSPVTSVRLGATEAAILYRLDKN